MLKSVLSLLDENIKIDIRSSLCGHTYSNKFTCNLCGENCPTNGLVWRDNTWMIEDCNYCGKCVAACPSHVFKLEEDYLLKKAQSNKQFLLTCNVFVEQIKNTSSFPMVNITCLNQLYPELILYLMAKQETLNIYFEPEKCSQCHNFNYSSLLREIQKIGDFSNKINLITQEQDLTDLTIAANNGDTLNRREFLNTMFRRSKRISLEVINESISDYNRFFYDNETENMKYKVKPEKRLLLLMALQNFNQRNLSYHLEELPYQYLHVDKCEFCELCVKLCPSGALEIRQSGDSKSLHYWPLRCNGCGLCQDACMAGEMTWGKNMELEDLFQKKGEIILAEAKAGTCGKCKEAGYFYPQDEAEHICYPCYLKNKMHRDTNPFNQWRHDGM